MPTTWTLHPRHRLDLRWPDLAYALGSLAARRTAPPTGRALARAGVADDGLVAASVRSGWALLLDAARWPAGSQVLVAGITHPEMAAVVTASGLVAVPVEVDLETLLPDPDALAGAVTPATRAVLVAQLFGARADLGGLAASCRAHGLLLVEDAAQAYAGPGSLTSAADVTLVSFGLLKTATAAGGAVLRVGDPALRAAMAATARTWPVQRRRTYATRLLRAAVALLVARRPAYGVLVAACRAGGLDPDAVLSALSRSRSAPEGLLARLHVRPCAPLLVVLARRLRTDDPAVARVRARAGAGEELRAGLAPARVPGGQVGRRTHWLFPVRAADPSGLVARLRAVGVDASVGTSNLVCLCPGGAAADLMDHVVYVPAYPELPVRARGAVHRVLLDEDLAEVPAGDVGGVRAGPQQAPGLCSPGRRVPVGARRPVRGASQERE